MRKLTKTIALVSLMTPASVLPLGVGDIKLHSALNQNLNAEIALLVSANENPSDIKVKLAPPDKFDEAGVPWSYFLSKIKFDLVTRPNGGAVIKLSSTEALTEPFLDFLLEVTWPQGNLYREFTVLVDPPATYQQPVVPVSTDAGVAKTATDYNRVVEKTAPATTASRSRQPVTEYGPVGRRDTLWTIAEKVKPYKDVSVEQVMMALYEANPKAFYKDNVNALTAGAKLKIPERDVILKLSRQQALAEFSRQNQAWKGQISVKTEPVKPAAEEVIDTQLKLLAPTQADVAENETVVSGEQESTKPSPVPSEPAQEQEQEAEASEPVNADMQDRLAKLEQQLAMMQQMLALKDEQLAALQNKQQVPAVTAPSQQAESPSDASVTAPPPKPVVPQPQPVAQAEPVVAESGSDMYYWLLGVLGIGALSGFGWLSWRKRQAEKETDTESMFAASSEISLPSAESQLNVPVMDEGVSYDVGTVGESSFLSEFTPSDFDAFDSDQHEVDPISEADVYLAYGRYQQAEDLIRHAIDENPDNDRYKLKLLEIFYANENKEAFEKYAEDLVQAGKRDDATFWEKVVEMGSELSPGAALFSTDFASNVISVSGEQKDPVVKSDASIQTGGDDAVSDLDFNLSAFDEPELDQSGSTDSEQSFDNQLDFDLSSFDFDKDELFGEEKMEPVEETEQVGNGIEFDLTSAVQAKEAEHDLPLAEETAGNDVESLDFDFSMPEPEVQSSPEVGTQQEDENALKELDDFNFSHESAEAVAEDQMALKEAEADFDFNFDFDLEKPALKKEKSDDFSGDLDLGVSDLTDMDEFETKIDLARAYIDMGDDEAAKDIAVEVLEKGNADQKEAAQTILDELK